MRIAPGSVLSDHEPVLIEQTWVINEHLVDQTFATRRPAL
jgi:hypothetical protein